MNGGGERQADIHSAGIFLDGAVNKRSDLGERFDGGEGGVDFFAGESQDFPIEIYVLAPAEFRIEAGPKLQQRGDPARAKHSSRGWLQDAADHLQKGALAGSIGPQDGHHFAPANLEAYIPQRPKFGRSALPPRQNVQHAVGGMLVEGVSLGNVLN